MIRSCLLGISVFISLAMAAVDECASLDNGGGTVCDHGCCSYGCCDNVGSGDTAGSIVGGLVGGVLGGVVVLGVIIALCFYCCRRRQHHKPAYDTSTGGYSQPGPPRFEPLPTPDNLRQSPGSQSFPAGDQSAVKQPEV